MIARFICPHCHASLNPHAMERAYSDIAEYRICPACDEAVFFALRDAPPIPPWLLRPGAGATAPDYPATASSLATNDADIRLECR